MSVQFLDHVDLDGVSRIRFIGDPVNDTDAANRRWVATAISDAIAAENALDPEEVRDVVSAMLRGTGIDFVYDDDGEGTLTLTVTDSPTVGGRAPGYLLSRANHTGTQSLDTTVDSGTRLAFTPAERTKLGGIAEGATANATDAALRDRATHTGTMSADDLVDGTVNAAFSQADATKLDGIATGATANATNAELRDRATHTGTQIAATISDFAAAARAAVAGTTSTATATAAYSEEDGAFEVTVLNSPLLAGEGPAFYRSVDNHVDGAVNRVFTAGDEAKLGGIAEGATANSTDAFLLARGNHTGTQPLSTITGHNKAAHDALGIDAGTVGGFSPADLRDRATHTGTQSLDTTTDSATRLALRPAERTKLDGIATGATANATDAELRDRATHTGTQSADTLTNGAINKVFTAGDRTKLDGIAEGATANATDAALRDRATHTGTQDVGTITGLNKGFIDALGVDAASVGGMTAAGIQSAVTAAIVDGAPGTLDTLNEIAAALGDNPAAITDLMAAVALRNRTVSATIGDGTATSFVVTHGLGSRDVTVQIWETGGAFRQVNTSVAATSLDTVTVSFGAAPAAGAYRVVVQGRPDPA